MGSTRCAYETASGRRQWPNRDPLGDIAFLTAASGGSLSPSMPIAEGTEGANLYLFVRNVPISAIDSLGLLGFDGNGKVYGNWCGGDWTGGKKGSYNPAENYAPAIDALDSACEVHDKCYYKCRERFPCNKDYRSTCFRLCDQALTKAAYQFGGVWGKAIGRVVDRSGTRDPEANKECCKDGGK